MPIAYCFLYCLISFLNMIIESIGRWSVVGRFNKTNLELDWKTNRPSSITNCDKFITNCDKYITNCDKYITNCGNYYKLRRLLQIVQSSIQVDKRLQWANVKQKPFRNILSYSRIFRHIRAYSVIFRHNQAYLGILQAYSKPCVTLAYSKPWYIQKTGTFRTRGIFIILWNIYNGAFCENR